MGGGRASRETSERLADMKNIFPGIVYVRSHAGETPGSRPLQRQKDALTVSNPRENSRGGCASRETPGRLADVEKISPRMVSVRSHTGETFVSRPLQRQNDALMVPNPRENSRGGRRFREKYAGKTSPTKNRNTGRDGGTFIHAEESSLSSWVDTGPPDGLL